MGAFARLYAFLGQIFNYGNTNIEKRSATMLGVRLPYMRAVWRALGQAGGREVGRNATDALAGYPCPSTMA
jgi:hypothetical protein